MPTGPFVIIVIFIMIICCCIYGELILCPDRENSPLCICRSSYEQSSLTDLFFSKISLSKCTNSYSTRQCSQGLFSPSSTHVTQIVSNPVNHSHCLDNIHCLRSLHTPRACQLCQIIPTSLLIDNTPYVISTSTNNLPTDSCFYICEHDKSCGFLCFDRRITLSINCTQCELRENISCRCVKVQQTELCTESTTELTEPRWIQKRGFPAAGILAVLVLVTILLIIVITLINRQIEIIARRKNGSIRRRSIATITTYRSRQPSPSTAITFPNTPLSPRVQLKRDVITTNTMVELLNDKSSEYVVDIHRRDDEDELSVFLLEKTSPLDTKTKKLAADDDDDIEGENQT